MRYFIIVFFMSLFVIGFAWQNVEVMKIKLEYKKLNKTAARLNKKKDVLMYRIEKYRNIEVVRDYARTRGYREIGPENMVVVTVDENGKK